METVDPARDLPREKDGLRREVLRRLEGISRRPVEISLITKLTVVERLVLSSLDATGVWYPARLLGMG